MSARIKSEALADKAVRAPVRRGFMVPMRDSEIVEALHEPSLRPRPRSRTRPRPADLVSRTRTIGFLVPMRVQNWRTKLTMRSEEHTSELQSRFVLVCRRLLE